MSGPRTSERIIPVAICLLILGMSASTFQMEIESGELRERTERSETHESVNFQGFTPGSIYSDATISNARGTVCYVRHDGTIGCWGGNDNGQLATGYSGWGMESTYSTEDIIGVGGLQFREVAVGHMSACAITESDELYCWGGGQYGQLGRPVCVENTTGGGYFHCRHAMNKPPQKVNFTNNETVLTISGTGGSGHFCAIMETGEVMCWGQNLYGQVDGSDFCSKMTSYAIPAVGDDCNWNYGKTRPQLVPFPDNRSAIAVTTGDQFSCAVLDNNSVYCWGSTLAGRMGLGEDHFTTVTTSSWDVSMSSIEVENPDAFPDSGYAVLGWREGYWSGKSGNNLTGFQLVDTEGVGTIVAGTYIANAIQREPIHIPMPNDEPALAIDSGGAITTAIVGDGKAVFWGHAGDNSTPVIQTAIPQGRTVISFSQSESHGCGILDNFEAWCGGQNGWGQLGLGSTGGNTPFSMVTGGQEFVGIATGSYYFNENSRWNSTYQGAQTASSCAINVTGYVFCWGTDELGTLGDGPPCCSRNAPNLIYSPGRDGRADVSDRDPDGDGVISILDDLPYGCPSGVYLVNGACTGVTTAGFYSLEYSTIQHPCPAGTFQPSPGQDNCLTSSAGHYSPEGSASEIICPTGHYQPDEGQGACLEADSGNYVSIEGETRQYECTPGSYQPWPGQDGCLEAQPGNFVSGFGSDRQTSCAEGSYQESSGMDSCTQADPGFYVSSEGSTSQEPCQPGSFSSSQGQDSCTEASPGFFVLEAESTAQSACQPGDYQPDSGQVQCLTADPGNFTSSESAIEQTPCPSGYYQPDPGQTSCIESEAGYFSQEGASSQTQCPSGTYSSSSGESECTAADPGYYVELDGATGQTACPPGQFQGSSGSGSCEEAPPGQIVSPDGTSTLECSPGTYKPENQSTCLEASPGHFVNESGASSQTPCAPGSYRSTSGKTDCVLASPGNYVPEEGSSGQTQCPKGEFQSFGGESSCNQAMPGHYVPEEGARSQTSCKVGNYQPESGQEDCMPADPGNFVSQSGATSQFACQPGTFQGDSGSSSCDPAQPGNFVPNAGATEQSKCPGGQEQELSGQASCVDVERPLWLSLLIFGVPSIILGTMAILYISNRKKGGGGGRGKAYMYSEDLTVGQLKK